jgi:hypothetical protein
MSEAAVCERGYNEIDNRLPLQELLGGYTSACRPSLPGLAKVCRLFEAFLKHEPAAATDMPTGPLLPRRLLLLLSR